MQKMSAALKENEPSLKNRCLAWLCSPKKPVQKSQNAPQNAKIHTQNGLKNAQKCFFEKKCKKFAKIWIFCAILLASENLGLLKKVPKRHRKNDLKRYCSFLWKYKTFSLKVSCNQRLKFCSWDFRSRWRGAKDPPKHFWLCLFVSFFFKILFFHCLTLRSLRDCKGLSRFWLVWWAFRADVRAFCAVKVSWWGVVTASPAEKDAPQRKNTLRIRDIACAVWARKAHQTSLKRGRVC